MFTRLSMQIKMQCNYENFVGYFQDARNVMLDPTQESQVCKNASDIPYQLTYLTVMKVF